MIPLLVTVTFKGIKMLINFFNDERGISAHVFKLAVAVVIAAVVIGIIIGLVTTFRDSSEKSVNTFSDASLDEVQSNADKIEGN